MFVNMIVVMVVMISQVHTCIKNIQVVYCIYWVYFNKPVKKKLYFSNHIFVDFIDILIYTLISIILWYNYIKFFFYRTGQLGNLTAPCNSHCKCSSSFYSTICGRDNIGYFSPCFAGCTQSKKLNDQQVIIFLLCFSLSNKTFNL